MRVTIKDIARRTGFSVTTVSLVLNNKAPNISKETKDIIFSAVKELNYRPNQLAVGLVKKRTKQSDLLYRIYVISSFPIWLRAWRMNAGETDGL